MLADGGGGAYDHRSAAELDGLAADPHGSCYRVWDLDHDVALVELRLVGCLLGGVHRCDRDAVVGELVNRLLRGALLQPVADLLFQHIDMLGAGVAAFEARVLQPLGMAERFAGARPHVVVAGGEDDIAVGCLVHAAEGRAAAANRCVGACRLYAAAQVCGDWDFVDREARVRKADFKRLPDAGDLALTQGCQCADAGVECGDAVDQREVCLDRGQIAVARERHQAAHCLTDGVEADLFAVGAVLAVSRDVDHDDLRVQLLELVVAEAHDVDGAGAEVLQEDV